jgi:hypothetical protein
VPGSPEHENTPGVPVVMAQDDELRTQAAYAVALSPGETSEEAVDYTPASGSRQGDQSSVESGRGPWHRPARHTRKSAVQWG